MLNNVYSSFGWTSAKSLIQYSTALGVYDIMADHFHKHQEITARVMILGIAATPHFPSYKLVNTEVWMSGYMAAYLINLPLSSLGGSRTILAITFPGSDGFKSFPSRWSPRNLSLSFFAMMEEWTSRSSRCISVSTTPGLTDMLVTLGSSQASWPAKWFIAALVAPYAPHVLTAPTDTPDEVNRMQPLDSLKRGNAALAYSCSVMVIWRSCWNLQKQQR